MKLWWVQRQTIVSTPKGKPVLTDTDRQIQMQTSTYITKQVFLLRVRCQEIHLQSRQIKTTTVYSNFFRIHTYQTRHIIRVMFLMLLVFSMWRILMFFLLYVLFSLICNIQNHNLLQNWLFAHLLFAFYLIPLPPPHNTEFLWIKMQFDILAVLCFALQGYLSRHDATQGWLTSRLWCSRLRNWGVSTLLIFAAFLIMASASANFPWESSHRGDSGIILGHFSIQKQEFLDECY